VEVYNPTPVPQPPVNKSSSVCWNQVTVIEDQLYWRNSCRGLAPSPDRTCLARPLSLAESEVEAYNQWYYSDRVLPVECQAQAHEVPVRDPFRQSQTPISQ